jgi:C1A family cysteine protease
MEDLNDADQSQVAPDLPDNRDHLYSAPQPVLAKLPSKKDLRSGCPPVYDQGQLGSCTANAISGAVQFEQKKQGLKVFMPSRLFVYYNERDMEGTVNSDAGAQIRDGVSGGNCRCSLGGRASHSASMRPPLISGGNVFDAAGNIVIPQLQ